MIPKVIHYCWFGRKNEPEEVKKCIKSWEKMCPEYTIKRWDESNFDVGENSYTSEAYTKERWSFVSDLARLKIIYDNGGIYLDTDVELLRSLNSVLDNKFFFALEKDSNPETNIIDLHVATGLGFGAEKGNNVLKSLIDEYNDLHFVNDCVEDLTPCPIRNTRALKKYGLVLENVMQKFQGGTIYPSEYFCPIECSTGRENFSNNTISVHHYAASWKSKSEKLVYGLRLLKRRIVGIFK